MNSPICPTCNNPKEMYYVWWCPRCEKPERKRISTLNLLQALRHVQAISGQTGYKDRFWRALIDLDSYDIRNDSLLIWFTPEDDESPYIPDRMTREQYVQYVKDSKLLVKTFNLREHTNFWVSW
jgi:hypothetical protein